MMKPMHSLKWIAFLALATVAFAAQDTITLRRELKTGATETYKVESEVKQLIEVPSLGEQDLIANQVSTVTLKTLSVDTQKGVAQVETLTKVEKSTTDGSLAAMIGAPDAKLPDPKTEKGTLDSRNRLVIARDPNATADARGGGIMSMGMSGMISDSAQALLSLIELPEQPLKVGETIEVPIPNTPAGSAVGIRDLKMTLKLVGERMVEGQTLLVLAFSGDMKLNIDSSQSPGAANNSMGNMKMSGTAKLSGEGLIEKATGKTISNVMNIKNDMKVFVEQFGMEFPVKGTIATKISLVK